MTRGRARAPGRERFWDRGTRPRPGASHHGLSYGGFVRLIYCPYLVFIVSSEAAIISISSPRLPPSSLGLRPAALACFGAITLEMSGQNAADAAAGQHRGRISQAATSLSAFQGAAHLRFREARLRRATCRLAGPRIASAAPPRLSGSKPPVHSPRRPRYAAGRIFTLHRLHVHRSPSPSSRMSTKKSMGHRIAIVGQPV